jgi:hypothetical protein
MTGVSFKKGGKMEYFKEEDMVRFCSRCLLWERPEGWRKYSSLRTLSEEDAVDIIPGGYYYSM